MRAPMLALLVAALAAGAAACNASAAPPPRSDAGVGRGDYCKESSACAWDDPCQPRRCGAARDAKTVTCEESSPPPGTCSCVEEMCTLRPEKPVPSAGVCSRDDDCAIDVGTGTCQAGGDALIGPIYREGPLCTCDGGHCAFTWSGPVACKSWKDCSWVTKPRLRAVPSKQHKRPVSRPVRACKDGEVDAICTPEGVCKMVGWSC